MFADDDAARHEPVAGRATRRELTARLAAVHDAIERAQRRAADTIPPDGSISRASEWLLDNGHVLRQALRQVRGDLPQRYWRDLPVVRAAGGGVVPRAHAIAAAIVETSGPHVDLGLASRYLAAYQGTRPLRIGELWAVPALLRLVTLETLARATARDAPWPPDEARVAGCILGLRALDQADWRLFVESLSLAEAELRRDPAGVHALQDFDTRDRYRHEVENLARRSGRTEEDVAAAAVAAAVAAAADAADARAEAGPETHVGWHLAGGGRPAFERALGVRPTLSERTARLTPSAGAALYLAIVALLTAAGTAAVALGLSDGPTWRTVLAAAAAVLPCSAIAVSIVHWLAAELVRPRVLAKLRLRDGIPDEHRTLIAVPALLASAQEVRSLVRRIETTYLGNSAPGLRLALLTDLADAPAEHVPGDDAVVRAAREAVRRLNERYGQGGDGPFLLLHRERRFHAGDGVWMGWERKRGKLRELNQVILGAESAAKFAVVEGDAAWLRDVRYVITLDADTTLPPQAARRLVAAMAHPLQRPVLDPSGERVVHGYTVLQPRVEIAPESASRTLFSRVFAGDTAIDLYTRAVSDTYHDLFGEGVYAGKGIYDVAAFERSLRGRAPEDALLSHDLFEGVHGRAGLASDVTLLEDYPESVVGWLRRGHRWIRGDWQLLPWLAPRVPAEGGGRRPNTLRLLDLWKIADNLRRSLVPPALVAVAIAGWTVLPPPAWMWTALVAFVLAVPIGTTALAAATRAVRSQRWRRATLDALPGLRDGVVRWILHLAFLPAEAWTAADAIARTLWRLLASRRRLLEWTSAADVSRGMRGLRRAAVWTKLAAAPVAGLAGLILAAFLRPEALFAAAPLAALWIAAPEIAFRVSRRRPARRPREELDAAARRRLRLLARRTWLFYERFVGPEDRWLPPDNFQEHPDETVAHRTSPTNVGFALASSLAAYDFGWVSAPELVSRISHTFATLDDMRGHGGHLLNWYDTRTLAPLEPRYVSTVDSGNLATCLLALAHGLAEIARAPLPGPAQHEGLQDTAQLLEEALRRLAAAAPGAGIERTLVLCAALHARESPTGSPIARRILLARHESETIPQLERELMAALEAAPQRVHSSELRAVRTWLDRVLHSVRDQLRELDIHLPWLALAAEIPAPANGDAAESEARAALLAALAVAPRLTEVPPCCANARAQLQAWTARLGATPPPEVAAWADALEAALSRGENAAADLSARISSLAAWAMARVAAMDFRFLYDPSRRLFRIGHDATLGVPDANCYDLLASEARLASFLAIAKGDVPHAHWLHLGRPLARREGRLVLLSWGGSMFEYLMPRLFVRTAQRSLLSNSCDEAVRVQSRYAARMGIPWGISESGYHRFDAHHAYQYRSFGVPALALRSDVGERIVVTPYASLLALDVDPVAVARNVDHLESIGMLGPFGLYEAADFGAPSSPPRAPRLVRSYMAHHQGMILVSLANQLLGDPFPRRLRADARVESADLLLHERLSPSAAPAETVPPLVRREVQAALPVPVPPWPVPSGEVPQEALAIGNGDLSLLSTASGGSWLRWRGIAVTRFRFDATLGGWGSWVHVEDLDSGRVVSMGPGAWQPSSARVEVAFAPHLARWHRNDDGLAVRVDVTVPPHDDVEVRRVWVRNDAGTSRRLSITSFAEVALAPVGDDLRHPAFAKLFVESRWDEAGQALVFRRRPRSDEDPRVAMAHAAAAPPGAQVSWESDRARFLGRGGSARAPAALGRGGLAGSAGPTLDPASAIRVEILVEPHAVVEVDFLTAVAETEAEALGTIDAFRSPARADWAVEQARIAAEHELFELGIAPAGARQAQRLLSALLYPRRELRVEAPPRSPGGYQQRLWSLGVSGDLPIVVVRITHPERSALVAEVLAAHTWWRRSGVAADVIVIDEMSSGYTSPVQEWLQRTLDRADTHSAPARTGRVIVARAENLAPDVRGALLASARVVLRTDAGTLEQQLDVAGPAPPRLPRLAATRAPDGAEEATAQLPDPGPLGFANGFGGFGPGGREYVVRILARRPTPAPWANVLANERFGALVTETGAVTTWCENSSENRLTPWSNDPVLDPVGQALWLRDEETAQVWSPTPGPSPSGEPYEVRHAAESTEFRHHSHGLLQRVVVQVVPDAPVQIVSVDLTNVWSRVRRVTATFYAEWVLGTTRDATQAHVVTEFDAETGALFARNPFGAEFAQYVAFVASSLPAHGFTSDRTEFLGLGGSRARPAALRRVGLAGAAGAGLDPCAAYQVHVNIEPGASARFHFLLGQGRDREEASALVRAFRRADAPAEAARRGAEEWERVLGSLVVRTPDPALDLLVNRWLPHQVLSCRVRGRTAVHQSGGAYGFRDQIQDLAALVHAMPARVRTHIMECASRQFPEGDVLHWWHASPAGPQVRGVRTRCSDDLAWLPWAVAHYVHATGDATLLDEPVRFLAGEPLRGGELERYAEYGPADETASVLDHCLRALRRADTSGPHGLPLIGTGDWNDGLSRVGARGIGESVWLAWFLCAVMKDFARVMEPLDAQIADGLRRRAAEIGETVERVAWDGAWYVRAYHDDGSVIGSARSDEARIDAISQAWAVLSGVADRGRCERAMDSVWEHLVDERNGLVRLLTPPFDRTPHDPGYVRAYPPGVRENGAQYTHAAAWVAAAYAALGQADRAAFVFSCLHPIGRASTPEGAALYRGEPYVLAADVYTEPPHVGRAGWTWYTGSASWTWRVAVESLLGLRRTARGLIVAPCLPDAWPGFEADLRDGATLWRVRVENHAGAAGRVTSILLDGAPVAGDTVPLTRDGREHDVRVVLGSA